MYIHIQSYMKKVLRKRIKSLFIKLLFIKLLFGGHEILTAWPRIFEHNFIKKTIIKHKKPKKTIINHNKA